MKPLMTLKEAAECVPFSEAHRRRCIRTPQPTATMPALKAKRDGKGRYLVRDVDLQAWIDAQEDA